MSFCATVILESECSPPILSAYRGVSKPGTSKEGKLLSSTSEKNQPVAGTGIYTYLKRLYLWCYV